MSRGVSLCCRPLLRLSRPGVSTAFFRCCRALIACGVVGAPFFAGTGLGGLLKLDWRSVECRVPRLSSSLGTCAVGVVGFWITPAS